MIESQSSFGDSEENMTALGYSPILRKRFAELTARHPWMIELEAIHQLSDSIRSPGNMREVSSDCFDAVYAITHLLSCFEDCSNEFFGYILSMLGSKLINKGGKTIKNSQLVDVVYECLVCLHVAEYVAGVELVRETKGSPDIVFTLHLQTTSTDIKVAIECKNISSGSLSQIDLIRKISDYLADAITKHSRRSTYQDLLVFVDLPLRYALDEEQAYVALAINVQNELKLRGVKADDAVVVYTSCCQSEMHSFAPSDRKFVRFRPVVTSPVVVGVGRALLLNCLFRDIGDSPNIANYGKRAIYCPDPQALLI